MLSGGTEQPLKALFAKAQEKMKHETELGVRGTRVRDSEGLAVPGIPPARSSHP